MSTESPSEQTLLGETLGLSESEERFRVMVNAMPQLAWIARPDGHIFWYNDRWYDYTGTTPEQMEGWGWQSVHDESELPHVLDRWRASIANGNPFEMTYPLRGADGHFRRFLTRVIPLKDKAGRVTQWFGTNTDVHELKQVETALRESDERMRLATEATAVGIWEWNINTNQIRWDAQMFRIYGIAPTKDGIVDYSTWSGFVMPEDLPRQEEVMRETIRRLGRSFREFRIRRPGEGECRHIEAVETVRTNALGQAEWVVGTNLDVTERKCAEKALSDSERFARGQWAEAKAALEAVPANIAILDGDGVILRVNRAWNCFASENGEFPGSVGIATNYLSVCDAATGADAALAKRFAAGIRNVIGRQDERFSMEYPCHAPGQHRWYMGYVTGISGDGVAKAVVAHVDITAQKSVEEQMRIINEGLESRVIERTFELQAAVDALEAEMAQRQRLEREVIEIGEHEKERVGQDLHDGLCQALSGIGLTTKSLLRKLESQSLPLAVVAAEVKRILDLIRDATDEARIVALGLYPVDIEEYGLAMALKKLAQDTEYHFDIECHCQCGTSVVLPDHYTAAHVYRIAQEAVSNAIKHGKADSVLITIAATGDLIILKIKDNGHGRLEELRETGMGLKTMKYRARALGGSLDLQQCPQRGLVVTCSFPNQSKPEA